MADNDAIMRDITEAWRDSTGWEDFGRDVGDILLANGITASQPTNPESEGKA